MTTLIYKNQNVNGSIGKKFKSSYYSLILPKCTWYNDDFSGNKNTAASSIRWAYQTTQTWQENRDLMAMNCAIQKTLLTLLHGPEPIVKRFIFGALRSMYDFSPVRHLTSKWLQNNAILIAQTRAKWTLWSKLITLPKKRASEAFLKL